MWFVKFRYTEKAPKIWKKSPNFFANTKHGWDFCGLLRISELYITPKKMFCICYPLSYSLQDRKKMKQTYLHLYEHRLHRLPSMQCYQIESKVSNHFYCMHKNLLLTCIHRVSIKACVQLVNIDYKPAYNSYNCYI